MQHALQLPKPTWLCCTIFLSATPLNQHLSLSLLSLLLSHFKCINCISIATPTKMRQSHSKVHSNPHIYECSATITSTVQQFTTKATKMHNIHTAVAAVHSLRRHATHTHKSTFAGFYAILNAVACHNFALCLHCHPSRGRRSTGNCSRVAHFPASFASLLCIYNL